MGSLRAVSRLFVICERSSCVHGQQPTTYVLSSAKLNATGQRWVNDLTDFNLQIHCKSGKTNVGVDALSRFPEDINLYHSTLAKETFEAVTDGTTTQQHKNEA